MGEILFASDLDNTLLFSYRHKMDTDRCVEHLEGKEQGFCTEKSLELLARVRERTLFVPVTTRSAEQYRRINWPAECAPRYAVTSNGGILLVNGEADGRWYEQTRQMVAPWRSDLLELQSRLPDVPALRRWRMVDGLYWFAVCDDTQGAQESKRFFADKTSLEVVVSGRKVYFFPPPLNKGSAICRLKERFGPDRTICAGDSVIDVPMLRAADLAIIPDGELLEETPGRDLRICRDGTRFPDFVLRIVCDTFR